MKKTGILILAVLLIIALPYSYAHQVNVLRDRDLTAYFDGPIRHAAKETVTIYPSVKRDIEDVFGWKIDFRASVVLVSERKQFQRMARSTITAAFALPEKRLIVIDYSRMSTDPFNLEITLKHELCHLLLYSRIGHAMPRWFEEGVCQWASDGIGEIIMDQKRSLLNRAAFKRRFIPLDSLEKTFPSDREGLLLAYEESKSFVTYIISRFGKQGVLDVLFNMREGEKTNEAFLKALSVPLADLEIQWQNSLKKRATWFTFLSYHLYEILFALTALIAIYAFIKAMKKKREYSAEESQKNLFP